MRRAFAVVLGGLAACHAAMPVSAPPSAMRGVAGAIVLCKTSEAELRAQLGEPYRNGRLGAERLLSWVARQDNPQQFLAVLLDGRGIVVDLFWDIPGAVSWVPANRCPAK